MSALNEKLPDTLNDAVLKASVSISDDHVKVQGIDYSKSEAVDMRASDLVESMKTMGFQASALGQGCEIINKMRSWRGKHIDELEEHERKGSFDEEGRQKTTIFLGYTSNLIMTR